MRKSSTQEFDYGCGMTCFALKISYKQAEDLLGKEQATSTRFWVKDLTAALNKAGESYRAKYVKPHLRSNL